MEAKTLRQIHASTGVTRRAVQGYEKAGLVSATGKNKYGHLLYDTEAVERISAIRFYQELGFSVKEIKAIIDKPNTIRRAALQMRISDLRKECEHLHLLIEKANLLLESLT